jgi:cell wall-associated NlpC family hydrolase
VTVTLDRRLHAIRPDLADARLRGRIDAPRFADGASMQIAAGLANLHREPRHDAGLDTQALCGERVRVFETHEGWAWLQLEADGYVGYTPVTALGEVAPPATHRVAALRSFVYPGASMKLPPLATLSLGARLTVIEMRPPFAVVTGIEGLTEAFVWAAHLAPLHDTASDPAADPVSVAETMLGAPYLWGGKSSLGLDCSGLVSLALDACGVQALRDTDMQERTLGVALADGASPQRGDLVFWKGHVGLMQSSTQLLHANGHHMLVVSEPLGEAVARIEAKGGGPVTSIRRL